MHGEKGATDDEFRAGALTLVEVADALVSERCAWHSSLRHTAGGRQRASHQTESWPTRDQPELASVRLTQNYLENRVLAHCG